MNRCDNCDVVLADDELKPVHRLHERVDDAGADPAGQCPRCGALCYPSDSEAFTVTLTAPGPIRAADPVEAVERFMRAARTFTVTDAEGGCWRVDAETGDVRRVGASDEQDPSAARLRRFAYAVTFVVLAPGAKAADDRMALLARDNADVENVAGPFMWQDEYRESVEGRVLLRLVGGMVDELRPIAS